MAKKKSAQIPTVLAFSKNLSPSAGYLSGTKWDDRESIKPLMLEEKSVKGTISNRLPAAFTKNPEKLGKEVRKANLQRVDACHLESDQDTLVLDFTLKVLGNIAEPESCNDIEFRNKIRETVDGYIEKHGMSELANRYALNIANGRFLWRNRVGASDIEIIVSSVDNETAKVWSFDGKGFSTHNFDGTDKQVKELAEVIRSALASKDGLSLLSIQCFAKVGTAQEVFPSEELVFEKEKGEKGKVLHQHADGQAGMHSQKIGNALRSIDTWYPDFLNDELSAGPIALDVYGAVTLLGHAFRHPVDTKQDFYTLFDDWVLGGDLSDDEQHYVVGVLIRGGVFGGK